MKPVFIQSGTIPRKYLRSANLLKAMSQMAAMKMSDFYQKRLTAQEIMMHLPIDSFHLDFRACAMDWRVKSAGSRGEHVSWVAGRARSCISLVLVVVKTSHFTATGWAQMITAA